MKKKTICKKSSEAIPALFEEGDETLLLTPGHESAAYDVEPMDGLGLAGMALGEGYVDGSGRGHGSEGAGGGTDSPGRPGSNR